VYFSVMSATIISIFAASGISLFSVTTFSSSASLISKLL